MENKILKFIDLFSKKDKWVLLFFFILFDFSFSILIFITMEYVFEADIFIMDSEHHSLLYLTLLYGVLAPIVETFFAQFLIIEGILLLFRRFKIKYSVLFAICASGLVFGLGHSYNWYYVFATFLIGILYALYYLIAKRHKNLSPFWTVAIVHSAWNLLTIIVYDL
jgi:membrane protease YdiL (CAAX protease family)